MVNVVKNERISVMPSYVPRYSQPDQDCFDIDVTRVVDNFAVDHARVMSLVPKVLTASGEIDPAELAIGAVEERFAEGGFEAIKSASWISVATSDA